MRQPLVLALVLGAAAMAPLVFSACGGDDDGDGCQNECTTNATQCSGTLIQACTAGAEGCLVWQDTSDCADGGQLCASGTGQAICEDACSDACPDDGALRCQGTEIERCAPGTDGCLAWATQSDCADGGQLCVEEVAGTPTCEDECVDGCATQGETQCAGTVIQSCEVGTGGCLAWTDQSDCDDTDQLCDDAGEPALCYEPCVGDCLTADATQCDGPVIQTCTLAGDGCLYWVDGTDCSDDLDLCDDASGTATCVADCVGLGPAVPSTPVSDHGVANERPALTLLDWADSERAVSYEVYFSTLCPPTSDPDVLHQTVTDSQLAGISVTEFASYCWQVVATSANGCAAEGPVWGFATGCTDPSAGPPAVTSAVDWVLPSGTTGATYVLTFSEPVAGVATALTWLATTGTGTVVGVVTVDDHTYEVSVTGLADGDAYTLTVGAGVTDHCGIPLAAPLDIQVQVESPPPSGYGDCANRPPAEACQVDEQCVGDGTGNAVCLEQACVDASDCAVPGTGNPVPTCADVAGDVVKDCYLDCSGGETCPNGMICVLGFVCIWAPAPLPPGVCPDTDLGSTVPQSVNGDNTGLGDDHTSSCGDGGGVDAMFRFTAPAAGSYVIDTLGSPSDTILSVIAGCGGSELACNDDAAGMTSAVTVSLAAGQSVIIVVEGYGGAVGPFTLNISTPRSTDGGRRTRPGDGSRHPASPPPHPTP